MLRSNQKRTIVLATRGSSLARAQTEVVLNQCQAAFPDLRFTLKIIKTTGDKLLTASLAGGGKNLPKGLFTKELEVVLLKGEADLAVHSLKDLPTDLPAGLALGAVTKRADPRDVIICRSGDTRVEQTDAISRLREGATVGTSSTRRRAQLLARRPDLNIVEIRGNIISRLQKLSQNRAMGALVLAAAGMERMSFRISEQERLVGDNIPEGLMAMALDTDVMLPCVGQGALGVEVRKDDERMERICAELNDFKTCRCTTAERAFLKAMGGGCASPVAAYAEAMGDQIRLRVRSFPDGIIRQAEGTGEVEEAAGLGEKLAKELGVAAVKG